MTTKDARRAAVREFRTKWRDFQMSTWREAVLVPRGATFSSTITFYGGLLQWLPEEAPKPKDKDGCPKCGHRGEFVQMALVCPEHGAWAGC